MRLFVENVSGSDNYGGLAGERVVEGGSVTAVSNVGPNPNAAGGDAIHGGRL